MVARGATANLAISPSTWLPDSPRRVVTFVAAAVTGRILPLPAVIEEMVYRRGLVGLADTRRTIDVLERLGVLATTRDARRHVAPFPVASSIDGSKSTWES